MRISDFLEILGDDLPYEYRGRTSDSFRGLGLKAERRGVRRCLYVLPEVDWHSEYPRMLRKDERPVEVEFETAIANGASGIVCPPRYKDHPLLRDVNCLFVPNTLEFAYRAAASIRNSLQHQKLIAVTGSAGKSTTKLMLADALRELRPHKRIQAVRENRNIAAQVLWQTSWSHGYDYSVLEVAGSAFLRFPLHGFSLSPDVAIITTISEAHLDYLDDLRGVAEYKSRILENGPTGGKAVINLDAPYSDLLAERAAAGGYDVIGYGESPAADIRMTSYSAESGRVTAEFGTEELDYHVGAHGKHMATNSLAVLGALKALGFEDLGPAFDSIAAFEAAPGRGKTLDIKLDTGAWIQLTDESFNANPASMRAALAAFAEKSHCGSGRKIAILGDIGELGGASAEIHRHLLDASALSDITELHLFGEDMVHLYNAISHPRVHYWPSLTALTSEVTNSFRTGDQVLVKASHSTGLNSFVKTLASNA